RDEVRRDPLGALLHQRAHHLLDERQAPEPDPHDGAYLLTLLLRRLESGRLQSLVRRGDGEVDEDVRLPDLLLFHVRRRVEVLDLPCDAARGVAGIEASDRSDPALPRDDRAPDAGNVLATRGYSTHSSHDYSAHAVSPGPCSDRRHPIPDDGAG